MSNVIKLNANQDNFEVEYITNEQGRVIGVSHPKWGFDILRNQESNKETALVCKDTAEPFGILDSDQFNTVLAIWLLIDDPSLIDQIKEADSK